MNEWECKRERERDRTRDRESERDREKEGRLSKKKAVPVSKLKYSSKLMLQKKSVWKFIELIIGRSN